jgi:hypothetical protein
VFSLLFADLFLFNNDGTKPVTGKSTKKEEHHQKWQCTPAVFVALVLSVG